MTKARSKWITVSLANPDAMLMRTGPVPGDPLPSEVAALKLPQPALLVWLRHVG
jgi:hypothetical protein